MILASTEIGEKVCAKMWTSVEKVERRPAESVEDWR